MVSDSGLARRVCRAGALQLSITGRFPLLSKWSALHFDILPWIKITNLGSHILALIRRRLPEDWTERYHTTLMLIEALALDYYSILRNRGRLGKMIKIRHLLELGIFLPVPLHRARWA